MTIAHIRKKVDSFVSKNRELKGFDVVVGISRGGLIPAALVAMHLDKPLVSVYIDRQDRTYLDRSAWIRGQRVLLIDDIVRTGKTLEKMVKLLNRAGAREVKTFTLYCLRKAAVHPDWTTTISKDKKMPWE